MIVSYAVCSSEFRTECRQKNRKCQFHTYIGMKKINNLHNNTKSQINPISTYLYLPFSKKIKIIHNFINSIINLDLNKKYILKDYNLFYAIRKYLKEYKIYDYFEFKPKYEKADGNSKIVGIIMQKVAELPSDLVEKPFQLKRNSIYSDPYRGKNVKRFQRYSVYYQNRNVVLEAGL